MPFDLSQWMIEVPVEWACQSVECEMFPVWIPVGGGGRPGVGPPFRLVDLPFWRGLAGLWFPWQPKRLPVVVAVQRGVSSQFGLFRVHVVSRGARAPPSVVAVVGRFVGLE